MDFFDSVGTTDSSLLCCSDVESNLLSYSDSILNAMNRQMQVDAV